MRTRNSLERLAAAGRPLLAESDAFADAAEEDRIREQIVSSDRSPTARRHRPPRAVPVLAAVAVIAVTGTVAGLKLDRGPARVAGPAGHHRHPHVTLSGASIEMAGYRFRTPAGFISSKSSCDVSSSTSGPRGVSNSGPVTPTTVLDGIKGAASADGGCLEAFLEIPGSPGAPAQIPSDAAAVNVGAYQGYFDSQGSSGDVLYVALPKTADEASGNTVYLVLYAQGLTEDQLVAIAQSGLPASP